ncbi:RDD family protein, partial [Citrobacter sp. AAK_AS5]
GFSGMDDAVLFSITVRNIVTYLVGALYFVLLTGFTGRTLGKMLLRIQVVRADGGKAGWWDVVYRETIGRYLSSLLC